MLGQLDETVVHGKGHIIEPGDDALIVFAAQIALDQIRPALVQELAVDLPEHVPVDQIIRVKDHQQVIFPGVVADPRQGLFQGHGLSGGLIGGEAAGLDHLRAHSPGHAGRVIIAVVGDDEKIHQLFRIIHVLQIIDDIADHPLLVMGGNQHQKAGLGIVIRVILLRFSEAEEGQHQMIKEQPGQPEAA